MVLWRWKGSWCCQEHETLSSYNVECVMKAQKMPFVPFLSSYRIPEALIFGRGCVWEKNCFCATSTLTDILLRESITAPGSAHQKLAGDVISEGVLPAVYLSCCAIYHPAAISFIPAASIMKKLIKSVLGVKLVNWVIRKCDYNTK